MYQAPGGVLPVPQTVKNFRRLSDVVFALVSILQIRIMTEELTAVQHDFTLSIPCISTPAATRSRTEL